jgi:tripartite-type tricarboxylate transporter receptor subunit TctC
MVCRTGFILDQDVMLIDQDRATRPTDAKWPASHPAGQSSALLLAIAASGIPLMEQAAAADALKSYPNRPIRLIAPQTPGSSLDTLVRIFAIKMSEALGQQLVVDNRGGAGGLIGMEIGKDAPPDGYSLIAAGTSGLAIVPVMHKKKAHYDSLKDFEFISIYSNTGNVLVVNPTQPPKTVKELIDWARARGSQINMASAGVGSSSHFTGSHFMMAANLQSTHVPYKGGGPSVAAVIAGEAQWTLTPGAAVMSHVKSGRLRALGHTWPQRTRILGDLPAIAETLTGFENVAQTGLIAPRAPPCRYWTSCTRQWSKS